MEIDRIPLVSKELYVRTRKAVEQAGYGLIVRIRPISVAGLLGEDTHQRFGYVNATETMRAITPPEMEVAINPVRFKIEGSNNLPIDQQKKKIKEEQTALRRQVLPEMQYLFSMEVADPSTISQIEDAYVEKTGKLLLPDYFVRTGVQIAPGVSVDVGRSNPKFRRFVGGWFRDIGRSDLFIASVVVLPRKLAA